MEAVNIHSRFLLMIGIVLFASMPQAHSETFGDSAISVKNATGIPDFILQEETAGSHIMAVDNLLETINALNTVVPEPAAEPAYTASVNTQSLDKAPKAQERPNLKKTFISSEASPECRLPGVVKNAPNFKRITEYECACELVKRSPTAREKGATEEDFHWYTQCKKSRYTVSLYDGNR